MSHFEFEDWDAGRLRVNRSFAGLLRENGLTTFEALAGYESGDVARQRYSRLTSRIVLHGAAGSHAFYLKRHSPASLNEYLRQMRHGHWPILGAANEWNAILRFHAVGIPTMEPVAVGFHGRRSLLVTESLDGHQTLLEWLQDQTKSGSRPDPKHVRCLIGELARITRDMHGAGLHHQDFYLSHLLIPNGPEPGDIRVLDLGRVRQHRRLGRRWIIKDLAQLDYSAQLLSYRDRLRFLRAYLGRPLTRRDRGMIRRISRKSRAIDRHTRKRGL